MREDSPANRYSKLRGSIPDSVKLIGVCKTVPADIVRSTISAGLNHLGENKVQEAALKRRELGDCSAGVEWHLIGHLQSNKVRLAVETFEWIHTVDCIELAERIERIAGELSRNVNILWQVKLAEDDHKFGIKPKDLSEALVFSRAFKNITARGLMTILPNGTTGAAATALFERLRALRDEFSAKYPELTELSMGMSADYREAIDAGATFIRLGTAIFGARSQVQ